MCLMHCMGCFAQALLADERPRKATREKRSNLFGAGGRKLDPLPKKIQAYPTKIRYIFQSLAISIRKIKKKHYTQGFGWIILDNSKWNAWGRRLTDFAVDVDKYGDRPPKMGLAVSLWNQQIPQRKPRVPRFISACFLDSSFGPPGFETAHYSTSANDYPCVKNINHT